LKVSGNSEWHAAIKTISTATVSGWVSPTKNAVPTHYELLGISLDEDDPDVIHAAVEQRRRFVESKRGDGHDGVVTEILYRISEAETTLLNNEMRREYDRQLELFEKRQKSRQIDPLLLVPALDLDQDDLLEKEQASSALSPGSWGCFA
jgi:hypothetical protein